MDRLAVVLCAACLPIQVGCPDCPPGAAWVMWSAQCVRWLVDGKGSQNSTAGMAYGCSLHLLPSEQKIARHCPITVTDFLQSCTPQIPPFSVPGRNLFMVSIAASMAFHCMQINSMGARMASHRIEMNYGLSCCTSCNCSSKTNGPGFSPMHCAPHKISPRSLCSRNVFH